MLSPVWGISRCITGCGAAVGAGAAAVVLGHRDAAYRRKLHGIGVGQVQGKVNARLAFVDSHIVHAIVQAEICVGVLEQDKFQIPRQVAVFQCGQAVLAAGNGRRI